MWNRKQQLREHRLRGTPVRATSCAIATLRITREFCDRLEAMGIGEVITAPRSPWQNGYVERIIGPIRRKCLDHIVISDERHLRRALSFYVDYHH
jgi:hypothetical protein